jgi:hypothetical protein
MQRDCGKSLGGSILEPGSAEFRLSNSAVLLSRKPQAFLKAGNSALPLSAPEVNPLGLKTE